MTQSPGHQKWPEHKVEEKSIHQKMQINVEGNLVADSEDIIEVDEDEHPPRYYVQRSDVKMDNLQKSNTTTSCPFKGKASYYNLNVDGKTIEDAAWSYEDPYDEHRALKDRIAFHDEKPEIELKRVH